MRTETPAPRQDDAWTTEELDKLIQPSKDFLGPGQGTTPAPCQDAVLRDWILSHLCRQYGDFSPATRADIEGWNKAVRELASRAADAPRQDDEIARLQAELTALRAVAQAVVAQRSVFLNPHGHGVWGNDLDALRAELAKAVQP